MTEVVSSVDLPRYVLPGLTRSDTYSFNVPSNPVQFLSPARRAPLFRWVNRTRNMLAMAAGRQACERVLQAVKDQLLDPTQGYLVRVNAQSDADGVLYPGPGDLTTPIGRGRSPIAVLAEDLRKPHVAPAGNPAMRDARWYCWISSSPTSGLLQIDTFSDEATGALEAQAREEAERRDVLGEFLTERPDGVSVAQRAEYWQQIARDNFRLDRGREAFTRMDALNREMSAAQQGFNNAYMNYQATLAEMARRQQQEAMLDRIGLAMQVVETGIGLNAARQAREGRVAAERSSQESLSVMADRHAEQAVMMREQMDRFERRLQLLWQEWQVTPPAAAPLPRYRRENGRLVREVL